MEFKLEVVPVPVTDVDRAKEFYVDRVGFVCDLDDQVNEQVRLVQLTPPGSACSIQIGVGDPDGPPAGSLRGLQLVVPDIDAARAELLSRGVPIEPVKHFTGDGWAPGKGGPWNAFADFADPDGNTWLLQERPS